MSNEQNLQNDDVLVSFTSENQLAEKFGMEDWISGCGHDCCTCDRECNK